MLSPNPRCSARAGPSCLGSATRVNRSAAPGTTVGAERRLCRTSAKTRQLRFRIRAGRTTDCRACRSGRGFAPRFGNRAKLGRGRLTDVLAACPLRSVELELPKHDAADLAGERLGQVGDELDAPRV